MKASGRHSRIEMLSSLQSTGAGCQLGRVRMQESDRRKTIRQWQPCPRFEHVRTYEWRRWGITRENRLLKFDRKRHNATDRPIIKTTRSSNRTVSRYRKSMSKWRSMSWWHETLPETARKFVADASEEKTEWWKWEDQSRKGERKEIYNAQPTENDRRDHTGIIEAQGRSWTIGNFQNRPSWSIKVGKP